MATRALDARGRGVAIAVAFLLAVGATGAVALYVHGVRQEASRNRPVDVINVVVAKENIPPGTKLDSLIAGGQFTTLALPASALVEGVVTDLAQLQGRTTKASILRGEQITTARLEGSKSNAVSVVPIPEGYQAVTIALEAQRVVNGLVQQGDHVVVYATVEGQGENATTTTYTVVPDVQVLKGVDPSVVAAGGTVDDVFVTLALTPGDAEKVVLAQEQGSIWLSLLPPGQKGQPQAPVSIDQLGR